MKSPKAVVVVTEGVGAGMLEAYGSATSTTPALNRLAASALVMDQCLVDSFDLAEQLRSLWTAAHARQTTPSTWNLWQHFSAQGLSSQLITDSPAVADMAASYGCPKVTLIEVVETTEPSDHPEDCALVEVFAEAMELLSSDDAPDVLWIHGRGLRLPWDAPLELRAAMIDPEDPLPPDDIHLPHLEMDDNTDPDLVVGWGQVAAAQLAVLDEAIEGLQQAIAGRADADEWSWMFCSLGGIALGEHQALGFNQQLGYSEEIAAAAMIRAAGSIPIGWRRNELCQLPDLPMTLLAAMNRSPENVQVWGRNLLALPPVCATTAWATEFSWAWAVCDQSLWVRTPAWCLLMRDQEHLELYVKPDDRWEVNDVADRSVEVIEQLRSSMAQLQAATESGRRDQLPSMPEVLASLFR